MPPNKPTPFNSLTLSLDSYFTPEPYVPTANFGFLSVNVLLINFLRLPCTYWGTWLLGDAKALAAYSDLFPTNTFEKGLKLNDNVSRNLGSTTAPGASVPSLEGFILLHGANSFLDWSGLGLCVLAVQLEAKNPVSTGLFCFVD